MEGGGGGAFGIRGNREHAGLRARAGTKEGRGSPIKGGGQAKNIAIRMKFDEEIAAQRSKVLQMNDHEFAASAQSNKT